MQMPGAGPSARKLMGGWFKKAPLSLSAEVFNWSRLYRILEGREMVKRVLDAPTDVESKADAFVYLCVQGTEEDLPLIDRYIDNAEKVEDFNPAFNNGGFRFEKRAPNNQGRPAARGAEVPANLG